MVYVKYRLQTGGPDNGAAARGRKIQHVYIIYVLYLHCSVFYTDPLIKENWSLMQNKFRINQRPNSDWRASSRQLSIWQHLWPHCCDHTRAKSTATHNVNPNTTTRKKKKTANNQWNFPSRPLSDDGWWWRWPHCFTRPEFQAFQHNLCLHYWPVSTPTHSEQVNEPLEGFLTRLFASRGEVNSCNSTILLLLCKKKTKRKRSMLEWVVRVNEKSLAPKGTKRNKTNKKNWSTSLSMCLRRRHPATASVRSSCQSIDGFPLLFTASQDHKTHEQN